MRVILVNCCHRLSTIHQSSSQPTRPLPPIEIHEMQECDLAIFAIELFDKTRNSSVTQCRAALDAVKVKLATMGWAAFDLEQLRAAVERILSVGRWPGRAVCDQCCTMHISTLWADCGPSLRSARTGAMRTKYEFAAAAQMSAFRF